MLRQPHRPQRTGVRPTGIHLGGPLDGLGRDAGDLCRLRRRIGLNGGAHLVEVVRSLRNECLVLEAERQNVIQHRRVERDVGAGLHLEMNVGAAGQLGAARVGNDQRGALLVRALQRRAEHWM